MIDFDLSTKGGVEEKYGEVERSAFSSNGSD